MLSNFPFIIALIGFLVSYRISVSFTRLVQEEAIERELLDHPNERSTHDNPIPRVGGLAIVGTFYVGVFITWALNGFRINGVELANTCHPIVLVGAGVMCLVGLYDDRKGISPAWKFFWQFVVAIATVSVGVQFESGFFVKIGWGWVPPVFTVFWIVGIINALNLIDGLDGLAAGVAGIASLFLIGALLLNGGVPHLFSGMAFLGALFGFLVYNWHPASIFMGDSGSLFLGYFLAVFALPLHVDADNYYLILVPVCALGLPIFDTLSAFTRRILKGKSPFSADKEHLHHRIHTINRSKSGHYRRTVYSLYIISVAFGAFALVLSVGRANWFGGIVVLLLLFIAILLYRYDYFSFALGIRGYLIRSLKPLLSSREEDEVEGSEESGFELDPSGSIQAGELKPAGDESSNHCELDKTRGSKSSQVPESKDDKGEGAA